MSAFGVVTGEAPGDVMAAGRDGVAAAGRDGVAAAGRDGVTAAGRDGVVVVRGDDLRAGMDAATRAGVMACRSAWDDLVQDADSPSRYRRYGRVAVEVLGERTVSHPLPHSAFRQDGIPLWAGRNRRFAPVHRATLEHPGLAALVRHDVLLAHALTGVAAWTVGLHLIRIVAGRGTAGVPTPEGRHRDGHDFVGMHLMRREGCTGGESVVYPADRPARRVLLTEPLDSLFVDDRRVTHEVTPTRADTRGEIHGARRDMLLVDLNRGAA